MAINQNLPATDSAAVLHELVGDDATASFENDPTFIDSNPGDTSSSNNLQTRADRDDIRNQSDVTFQATADEDDDDEEDDEEDDDDDDDEVDDEDEEDDEYDDDEDEDEDGEDEDEEDE